MERLSPQTLDTVGGFKASQTQHRTQIKKNKPFPQQAATTTTTTTRTHVSGRELGDGSDEAPQPGGGGGFAGLRLQGQQAGQGGQGLLHHVAHLRSGGGVTRTSPYLHRQKGPSGGAGGALLRGQRRKNAGGLVGHCFDSARR